MITELVIVGSADEQVDRVRAAAGDIEIDRDRRRAHGVVGGGDRLRSEM